MTRVGADTPLWQTDIYMAVFGLGLGMNMQSIVLAMQNSVDPRDMGVATSAVTFFRQVGGSLGTAVFLSILFTNAGSNISSELAKSGVTLPAGKAFDLNDTSGLANLPANAQASDPGRLLRRHGHGVPGRGAGPGAGRRALLHAQGGPAAHGVGPAGPARGRGRAMPAAGSRTWPPSR